MEDTPGRLIPWTDTEKLGFILQIVAKVGKIPWAELELPAGRSLKACQIMLGKERDRVKKAEGGNANVSPSKATPKKRKIDVDETPKTKKPRATKGSAAKAKKEAETAKVEEDDMKKEEEDDDDDDNDLF